MFGRAVAKARCVTHAMHFVQQGFATGLHKYISRGACGFFVLFWKLQMKYGRFPAAPPGSRSNAPKTKPRIRLKAQRFRTQLWWKWLKHINVRCCSDEKLLIWVFLFAPVLIALLASSKTLSFVFRLSTNVVLSLRICLRLFSWKAKDRLRSD